MNTLKILAITLFIGGTLGACQKSILISANKVNHYREYNGKNLREGVWVEEDSLSQTIIAKYNRGIKDGREISFDSLTYAIGFYKKGLKDGWFKYYTNDGTLMSEYLYSKDTVEKYKIHRTYSPKF